MKDGEVEEVIAFLEPGSLPHRALSDLLSDRKKLWKSLHGLEDAVTDERKRCEAICEEFIADRLTIDCNPVNIAKEILSRIRHPIQEDRARCS